MSNFSKCAWILAAAGILTLSACQKPCQCECDCDLPARETAQAAPVAANQAAPEQAKQENDVKAGDEVAAAAPQAGNGVKKREEIEDQYKWNKSRLFESDDAFKAAITQTTADIAKIDACQTFDTAASLKQCLDIYFDLHTAVNKLTLYANMTVDTEPSSDHSVMKTNAQNVLDTFMTRGKVVRDGILKIAPETLDKFFAEDPSLKPHEAYIRNIARRASRVLPEEAERVLSLAGDNLWAEIDLNEIPSNAENTFDAMIASMQLPMIKDENGNEIQMTLSNYQKFRRSPNRDVRKAAVDALMGTLAKYENVFANTYIGQLQQDILFARARKYDTALEAYLDKDDIPVELYKNLIDTVSANLAPLHHYVELRKKVMGLNDVHIYDLYVDLANGGDEKSYTLDEARTLIATALAPLGEDYITRLKAEMDPTKGSIDYLPHEGKESGAYSCSVYGVSPYILTNYQDSLDDVSTLAHELGHSMHSIYSNEVQPPSSYHYTMFLAEIASTTNESLLNDYLVANATTDAEKVNLLVQKLENIRGTIYRQTQFAEFEYLAHSAVERGEAIDAKWLKNTYADLVKKYYGEGFTVDENDGYEWSYVPHFYYKYYVYSYATGLSSALAFAKLIEASPDNAAKYINMLKSGSSKNSVELLREAGVDLTTPAPIENALKEFDETVQALEKLLVK